MQKSTVSIRYSSVISNMALKLALKRAAKNGERIILDRGKHIPVKNCVICQRDFTWRKKWENVWEDVKTCSKKCNKIRRSRMAEEKKKAKDVNKANSGIVIKGQKPCDLCKKNVNLLIRCNITPKLKWKMICGKCWNLPSVANGVVDGDKNTNPYYKYGGLWKNLHV